MTTDSRPRVYCWHRHGRFVSEWLMQNLAANVSVQTISHPKQLYGLQDATFIQVCCVDSPNDRSSDSLADIAVRQGFTVVTIDDNPKRVRVRVRV